MAKLTVSINYEILSMIKNLKNTYVHIKQQNHPFITNFFHGFFFLATIYSPM